MFIPQDAHVKPMTAPFPVLHLTALLLLRCHQCHQPCLCPMHLTALQSLRCQLCPRPLSQRASPRARTLRLRTWHSVTLNTCHQTYAETNRLMMHVRVRILTMRVSPPHHSSLSAGSVFEMGLLYSVSSLVLRFRFFALFSIFPEIS